MTKSQSPVAVKKQPRTHYAKVEVKRFPIAKLQPAPYNARTITDAALKGLTHSLERFGLLALPVVNERADGLRIVSGHQRVDVLRAQGVAEVDCVVVRFDDAQEQAANFAMNNPAIEGTFVPELTRELLARLDIVLGEQAPDLTSELRFDMLLKQVMRQFSAEAGPEEAPRKGKTDDDAVVSLGRTKSDSRLGRFYQLGEHRVFCGKLTEVGSLQGFGVERADVGLTRLVSAEQFTDGFLDVYLGHLLRNTDGGVYVATCLDRLPEMHAAFERADGHWSQTLVAWDDKVQARLGDLYRDVVIPIVYGWSEGATRLFFGGRAQSNVMPLVTAPPKDDLPVDLVVKLLQNSSRKGDVVLDVAVASGAVLIAAEKTERKLVGYVGNPREMDRLRARWARFVHGPDANWKTTTVEVLP